MCLFYTLSPYTLLVVPNKSEKAVAVSTAAAAEVVPIFVGLFLVGDGRFVFFRAHLLGVLWSMGLKKQPMIFFCSLNTKVFMKTKFDDNYFCLFCIL